MPKRDPAKTARNIRIRELKARRKEILEDCLVDSDCDSEASINAKVGSKYELYCNVKSKQIPSPDAFASIYLRRLLEDARNINRLGIPDDPVYQLAKSYQDSSIVREYVDNLLESAFLTHYEKYTRAKPPLDTSLWLGQRHAEYGLLITPRYNTDIQDWENDKSEIRKFKPNYFTIGHVLDSGLCIPKQDEKIEFKSLEDYLSFFRNTLVRASGSQYELELADLYRDYVRSQEQPEHVPLMLPELRYSGALGIHKYRLDFCIIDPFTFQRTGIELSPWSTHGLLTGVRHKTQKQVNAEALANFEREVKKQREYFLDKDIVMLIFTDTDLKDIYSLFSRIKRFLSVQQQQQQLLIESRMAILEANLNA